MKSVKAGVVMAAVAATMGLGTARAADAPALGAFAIDSDGSVVLASPDTHQVLRVENGGRVVVLAGTGEVGDAGDGGYATDALLERPTGVAFDADGNLFVGDVAAGRVRRIDGLTGVISDVKGAKPSDDEAMVKVKDPNQKETLYIGYKKTLRWAHNLGKDARFRIEVSRDRGKTWETIAQGVAGKTYLWRVSGPATDAARFRVTQEVAARLGKSRTKKQPHAESDVNDADVRFVQMAE